jgi:hypothetical protein
VNVLYIEARTCTVKRTLVPNVESLEFGEIPVAFRKVIFNLSVNDFSIDLRNFNKECWFS